MADLRQGYWVHLLPAERCDGRLGIHLLARRTYRIAKDDVVLQPLPDEEQPPFLEDDRRDEGKPEVAPPTVEMELVPEKARVDVVVVGQTYAPGGKPAREWTCGVRVGSREVKLRILGPRKLFYVPPQKREGKLVPQLPRFGEPEPVKEVPLSLRMAYGGKSRFIPDDETLKLARAVNDQMAAEQAEEDKKTAAARQKKADEEAKKEAERKEKELFETLGEQARRKAKEEKLKRGDGSEGFDHEGVRLWDAAASKDGTAVLSLDELEAQQLAEMARREREAQEEAERKAKEAPQRKLRQNAAGEWLEVDDQVAVLSNEELQKELAQSEAEQAAAKAELAEASRQRMREQVQQNDGTRTLDIGELPEDQWHADLKRQLDEGDGAERKAWDEQVAAQKKFEDEKLKDFPELPCPTNAYGKGFLVCLHETMVKRTELPQIEDPAAPLTPKDLLRDPADLASVPFPAGFSCWPREARPRFDLMGPLPSQTAEWPKRLEEHKRSLDLEKDDDVRQLKVLEAMPPPEAMKPGYYNVAAPAMQWHELVGDEEVQLSQLTKDGTLFFKLPGKVLEGELDRGRGIERKDMRLDTLLIEPEAGLVTMLWRTWFDLPSWDALADYPHMVGWVLDLDVQARKDRDWAARLKASQGDGTAVLDLSKLDEEMAKAAKLEPKVAAPPPEAPTEGTAALDLEKMGTYRLIDDDGWVKKASDGTVDVAAEERAAKAEQAYVEKKAAAIKALEGKDQKDAERREEVATAVQAGKPIPPKDGPKKPKPMPKPVDAPEAKLAPKPTPKPAAKPKAK